MDRHAVPSPTFLIMDDVGHLIQVEIRLPLSVLKFTHLQKGEKGSYQGFLEVHTPNFSMHGAFGFRFVHMSHKQVKAGADLCSWRPNVKHDIISVKTSVLSFYPHRVMALHINVGGLEI